MKESIKLSLIGLPVIETLDQFSDMTHISKGTLFRLSRQSGMHYKSYEVPKRHGGMRTINQPSKDLKGLQSWILVNILYKLSVSSSCKGFEKGSSVVKNVEPHKDSNAILVIDLEDFFPSIRDVFVYNIFRKIGYNKLISTVFTNICTYQGILPQGSPSSPRLANLVTWRLDRRIQGLVGRRGVTYTRYADDLTFSSLSPSQLSQIVRPINSIVLDEGFRVNDSKTRLIGPSRARLVTGLIITNNGFGIGRKKYRILRATIHRVSQSPTGETDKLFQYVRGWLAYLNAVDKKRSTRVKEYIKKLAASNQSSLLSKLLV
jgi:retron-type reverse transcriptase